MIANNVKLTVPPCRTSLTRDTYLSTALLLGSIKRLPTEGWYDSILIGLLLLIDVLYSAFTGVLIYEQLTVLRLGDTAEYTKHTPNTHRTPFVLTYSYLFNTPIICVRE